MFRLFFRWKSNKRCLPLSTFTSLSNVFLFHWLRPEWENAFPDRFIIVIQIRGVYSCQGNRDVNSCPKQVNSSHLTFVHIHFRSEKHENAVWLNEQIKCTFFRCLSCNKKHSQMSQHFCMHKKSCHEWYCESV